MPFWNVESAHPNRLHQLCCTTLWTSCTRLKTKAIKFHCKVLTLFSAGVCSQSFFDILNVLPAGRQVRGSAGTALKSRGRIASRSEFSRHREVRDSRHASRRGRQQPAQSGRVNCQAKRRDREYRQMSTEQNRIPRLFVNGFPGRQ